MFSSILVKLTHQELLRVTCHWTMPSSGSSSLFTPFVWKTLTSGMTERWVISLPQKWPHKFSERYSAWKTCVGHLDLLGSWAGTSCSSFAWRSTTNGLRFFFFSGLWPWCTERRITSILILIVSYRLGLGRCTCNTTLEKRRIVTISWNTCKINHNNNWDRTCYILLKSIRFATGD